MDRLRAQSSTLSVVLLVGIILTSATGVAVIGGGLIDDISGTAEQERASQEMAQFASESAAVALGGSDQRQARFDASAGTVRVREDASWICVEKGNATDREFILPEGADNDATCGEEKTYMGSVVYDTGGETVAYEGGGVWSSDDSGGSRMVSPPEFHYRGDTLTLPVVNVSGNVDRGGSEVNLRVTGGSTEKVDHGGNPLADDSGRVYVTIGSQYYEAWGNFLAKRTDGRVVNETAADETVTVRLVVPSPVTIENAIRTVSTGDDSVYVQDMEVDSYDSDTYSSSDANDNGNITTEGGANPIKGKVDGDVHTNQMVKIGGGDNPARINGSIHSQQKVEIVDDGSVRDDVYSNETVLKSKAAVEGDIHAKKVDLQNSDTTVDGDVRAGDELFFSADVTIGGDTDAQEIGGLSSTEPDFAGDVRTEDTYGEEDNSIGVPVSGELHAEDGIYTTDASFGNAFTGGDLADSGSTYNGDVNVSSDATMSETTVDGDIRVGGDLTTKESTDIDGSVYVAGDADLSSTTIDGDLHVGGDIDCSDSTLNGDVYGNVESDSGCDIDANSSPSVKAPVSPEDPRPPKPPADPDPDLPGIEVPPDDELNSIDDTDCTGDDGTIQVGSSDEHCKLEPGTYKVSKLDIDQGDLTFKQGGKVELYVEGDVSLSGDGTVTTAPAGEHNATRVEINVIGDSTVDIQGMSFTGVINAPKSTVDMGENNGVAEVFGAVVAEKVQGDSGAQIHYDEDLSGQTVGDGKNGTTSVQYLHVTENEIQIED